MNNSQPSTTEQLRNIVDLIKYEIKYADTHGGCPPAVRGITRHGVDEAVQQLEALLRQEKIAMLEYLHRNEGKGLPKRDYDNVTDELIDEQLEALQHPTTEVKGGE